MTNSADDEFLELLKKSPYKEPSPFGEILIHLSITPASMQSRPAAIAALQAAIHQETAKYDYLLSGDVNMEITWQFHERNRYESDASADIDNLLQPMLDAFCEPNGLLIDDCQIRSLGITWISAASDKPAVTIQIKFIDSDFFPKAGIAFVQIQKAVCMPVNLTLPKQLQRILFVLMRYQFAQRRFAETILRMNYYSSRAFLPAQRRFHRTRLRGFKVMSPKDYRAELRRLP